MTLTHRPLPALLALAAQLRLGALGLLVEVLAALGAGRLAAALRRRMARDIGWLERFATGILVLMALKTLPSMPESRPGGRRPSGAPPGFARVVAVSGSTVYLGGNFTTIAGQARNHLAA